MSGNSVADFLAYWESEGQAYVKRGDYDWMAALVPGQRVLEIGCGLGFGTQALVKRGLAVLTLDSLPECLEATRHRLGDSSAILLQAEITALRPEQEQALADFAPDSIVCWLMGAPAEITGATLTDGGQAVAAYREKIHRATAELAAGLPSVRFLHFVDRTAIAWQAKDIGRDTLVNYHNGKTLHDLPFAGERARALYRKLGDSLVDMPSLKRAPPALRSVVPVLASLLAERK